jgi:hypothetical protein
VGEIVGLASQKRLHLTISSGKSLTVGSKYLTNMLPNFFSVPSRQRASLDLNRFDVREHQEGMSLPKSNKASPTEFLFH